MNEAKRLYIESRLGEKGEEEAANEWELITSVTDGFCLIIEAAKAYEKEKNEANEFVFIKRKYELMFAIEGLEVHLLGILERISQLWIEYRLPIYAIQINACKPIVEGGLNIDEQRKDFRKVVRDNEGERSV